MNQKKKLTMKQLLCLLLEIPEDKVSWKISEGEKK
jgi:hypothetical protein